MPAPSRRELRGFGVTVGGAFVVLAAAGAWRGRDRLAIAAGAAGAALLLAAFVAPARLASVHRRWMELAHAMSRVTTPVMLAVVYFGVLTPLGMLLRVVRRRGLGPRRTTGSFLVRRPPGERQSDLRRQF